MSDAPDDPRDEEAQAQRSLTGFSIRRGVTTSMLYLAFAGFGLFSLLQLPVNRLPEVELPVIAVVTTYTGASPRDIETLVTEPIERAVSSVGSVEKVESTSRQGVSIVLISFTWGTDMSAAEFEVRKNLELFAGEFLPDDATKPLTFAFDPSLAPVVFLSMEGPLDGFQLRQTAEERVQPYLGRVDGVAAAEIMGGLDRQIHVYLKLRQLQSLGIAPAQVVDALRASNVVMPSGYLDDGVQAMNLQPTGLYRNIHEIENVVVAYRGARAVLVRDVAEVVDGFEEETHVVTTDGTRAVMIAVRKQSDANTVQTAQNIRAALPEIRERLPEGVTLEPLFDESESILRAVTNLALTGGQAFFLTGLVLLLFLRSPRTSLISIVAVPTSILVSFGAMAYLNVTLNLISLAGLALAVGMLVDNAIVVLEATFQYLEQRESRARAALLGTREMAMPLFASTLTTVVVFLPILLVEGIAGELFRDLILAITLTLLASLVVALSLVPLLASRFVGLSDGAFTRWLTERTRFLDRIGPGYERALRWSLAHRRQVFGLAFLLFAGALGTVPLLGQDFLPPADVSQIRMELEAAPGTSLGEMRAMVQEVEEIVAEVVPERLVVNTDYGASQGFAALFGATANRGVVRVKLPPPTQRSRTQQEIEAELNRRLRDVAGMEVRISGFDMNGGGGDVAIKLFSEDLDLLREWGERLRDELGRIEGVGDARFTMVQGSPELRLDYDREQMRQLGISPAQVASAVAIVYQGETATFFRDGGDEFFVRVRAAQNERTDLDALRYLPIPLPQPGSDPGQESFGAGALVASRFIPLSAVASVGDQLGPTDIDHENQRRYASVKLSVEGFDLGSVVAAAEQRLAEIGLPEEIHVEIGGTAEDLRDAFFKLAMAFLAAVLLVYMVMASQFESLLEPFVIMFTVPLSIVGVIGALALTGTTVQVTALFGVILLAGVIVNNGIVLVDVLKRRRAEGRDLREAALEAGRTRVRPILMTALTTILGMFPLALGLGDGAENWAPMARAVIGGMIVGTLLTLFVIPLLYVSLREKLDGTQAAPSPHEEVDATTSPERGDDEPEQPIEVAAREHAPQNA